MPIYEYECAADGTVIELIRPMADADKPVQDPDGKGRVFKRKHSVFASSGSPTPTSASGGGGGHVHTGSCGCGRRPGGSCGA
jgi:putative FmdB family regulatory protein